MTTVIEVDLLEQAAIWDRADRAEFTVSRVQLSSLIREASAALRDQSSKAEDRVRQADAILEQAALLENQAGTVQRTQAARKPNRGGLAGWQIRRLKAYVQERLASSISVADMAMLVRLSPHHFCRAFRASLNETPHNFVLQTRIQRAFTLMRTTGLPLSQVAIDCGFADQAHFNKSFRRKIGQSPGEWRRQQVESSAQVEIAVYGDWQSGVWSRACAKSPTRPIATESSAVRMRSRPALTVAR